MVLAKGGLVALVLCFFGNSMKMQSIVTKGPSVNIEHFSPNELF